MEYVTDLSAVLDRYGLNNQKNRYKINHSPQACIEGIVFYWDKIIREYTKIVIVAIDTILGNSETYVLLAVDNLKVVGSINTNLYNVKGIATGESLNMGYDLDYGPITRVYFSDYGIYEDYTSDCKIIFNWE